MKEKMFKKIVLGQTILKFETPVEILDEINLVYQDKFEQLPDNNYRLVGKMKKEKRKWKKKCVLMTSEEPH